MFISKYLLLPVSLYVIALQIDFVKRHITSTTILIFNRTFVENYLDISNIEPFFKFHEVIKYGRVLSNLS